MNLVPYVYWFFFNNVNPKGNQPWLVIGRTDAEAEAPVLWPPDAKSQLIGKDPDAGRNWRQKEKGMTEDEMVSITNSRSLFKPMSIESVMPSNHVILCHPLLLLPSIFPSIRGCFSSELVVHIWWPKYWSFTFNHMTSHDICLFLSDLFYVVW